MEIETIKTNIIPHSKLISLLTTQNKNIKALLTTLSSKTSNPPKIEEKTNEIKETLEISNIENAKYIQYSSLYKTRFNLCINSIRKQAQSKWGEIHICNKILDLKKNVTLLLLPAFRTSK